MKNRMIPALILAVAMTAATVAGCSHNTTSGSTAKSTNNSASTLPTVEDLTVVSAEITEEKEANDTNFTLNRVIDAGVQTPEGGHYFYLDITVKNNTDEAYELSTLNNFYLALNDGSEITGAIQTQLYAVKNLSDKYNGSPFTVPANGEFSGIMGGFLVPSGKTPITVGFFPTKADINDKRNVFRVSIKASDIIEIPDELKK